jgi:hypothetical protein
VSVARLRAKRRTSRGGRRDETTPFHAGNRRHGFRRVSSLVGVGPAKSLFVGRGHIIW